MQGARPNSYSHSPKFTQPKKDIISIVFPCTYRYIRRHFLKYICNPSFIVATVATAVRWMNTKNLGSCCEAQKVRWCAHVMHPYRCRWRWRNAEGGATVAGFTDNQTITSPSLPWKRKRNKNTAAVFIAVVFSVKSPSLPFAQVIILTCPSTHPSPSSSPAQKQSLTVGSVEKRGEERWKRAFCFKVLEFELQHFRRTKTGSRNIFPRISLSLLLNGALT